MDDWLKARLAELEASGLLREPQDAQAHLATPPAGAWLDACSNDYLGLAAHTVSRETMDSVLGAQLGGGASRLVQGTFAEHTELEQCLAEWLARDACLLVPSAFAANVGLLPALADADSLIVSDALNHASIVDGCRLSRARIVVTPHLDLSAVEDALRARATKSPPWVVTEGLFSMDGDCPNLPELRTLCDRYGAGLIVDEAHSLGVFGPGGAGLASTAEGRADIVVAGLGKAVGIHGGLVGGSRTLTKWLWNRARSFVFSTALSPAFCRLILGQVRAARAAEAARQRLQILGDQLRAELAARGLPSVAGCRGPIVPVVLGSNERAMRTMNELRRQGMLVQAIRPPTVPINAARLRLTVHANWPDDAPQRLARAIEVACGS